jgi:hypothetical protein
LGLLLCSFLGGNCGTEGFTGNFNGTFNTNSPVPISGAATPASTAYDNYQHGFGSSTGIPSGAEFVGKNGGKVIATTNSDGTERLKVILPNEEVVILTSKKEKQKDSFDKKTDKKTDVNNKEKVTIFYGSSDDIKGKVISIDGKITIQVEKNKKMYEFNPYIGYNNNNNNAISNTQYYGSTGYNINPSENNKAFTSADNNRNPVNNYQNNKGVAYSSYGGYNNNAGYNNNNAGYNNNNAGYNNDSGNYNNVNPADYASSLPPGIPRSMIQPGQEDLYILKSQVVPPVCPACPSCSPAQNLVEYKEAKCPPCKPCGRCPEPSFECKKVPNYNAIGNDELPIPVLNDFSTFGM